MGHYPPKLRPYGFQSFVNDSLTKPQLPAMQGGVMFYRVIKTIQYARLRPGYGMLLS